MNHLQIVLKLKLNKTFLFFLLFYLTANGTFGQYLVINEFMASNSSTIKDNDNDYEDWVELYNRNDGPVNIGGLFISDDLNELTKWQIPDTDPSLTTIPPGGFLILWLDKEPDEGPLHVNTKLTTSGEDIVITASDGISIIDSYTFGPQTIDISMGRATDGSDEWIIFSTPSPGSSNYTGDQMVMMPAASMPSGHYNEAISINLNSATNNAVIRYTTDGSEPTNTSSLYSTPLIIDATTTLRSKGFSSDSDSSRTMTHTYLFEAEHAFPIVCLSTNPNYFFDTIVGIYENWRDDDLVHPVHAEFIKMDGESAFEIDAEIKLHGGGSTRKDRKGMALIARSEYGQKKINYPIFSDRNDDEYRAILLRSSGQDFDRTLFRDAISSSLANDFSDIGDILKKPDLDEQKFRPSIVYLNGNYFGIHNIREKLDWRYLERRYGVDKNEVDIIDGRDNPDRGNDLAWTAFVDYLENNTFTNKNNLDSLKKRLDINNYIDNHLLNMYVCNTDWPSNNNKRWREQKEDAKWRFMTYDMDYAFGMFPLTGEDWGSGDWNSNMIEMVLADSSESNYNRPYSTLIMRKLMENEETRHYFINRMADQLNTMFTPERVTARIDAFKAMFAPEAYFHHDFFDLRDWDEQVDIIRLYGENRAPVMFDNFENYFEDITGQSDVSITANPVDGGRINFSTLRLNEEFYPFQGTYFSGVNIPAKAVAAPGYIFQNWSNDTSQDNPITTINLDGDENITANFILGSTEIGQVVINEINYNSPDSPNSGDWIELYNAGTSAVDISGWIFEDHEDYFNLPANTIIPANGYLVIVEDSLDFSTVYPNVENFLGSFGRSIFKDFKLSNSSENIRISNANRTFIDTVHYKDDSPWPLEPDGNGPTLQLIDASLNNAIASSWRAYSATPGKENGFLATIECSPNLSFTAEPGAEGKTIVWDLPNVETNCDLAGSELQQTSGPSSGSVFPIGTTTISHDFETACGVTKTCSFDINVTAQEVDFNLSCDVQDITLSAPVGSSGSVANWTEPTTSSNCYLSNSWLTQTSGLSNGSVFPVGTTLVKYEAKDDCDNLQFCSFNVSVEQDEFNYELTCPENLIVNSLIGTDGMIVNWNEPYANTNCEINTPIVTQTVGPDNGSFLPVGTTTISYLYDTGCNETSTCSFEITVQQEALTFNLECPENLILSTPIGASEVLVNWELPITNTNCEINSSELIQLSGPTNGTFLPVGTSIVSYEYKTGCDLTTSCSFEIIINSSDAVISYSCPNDISVNALIGATGIPVDWEEPTASSDCFMTGIDINQTDGLENGSEFPIGMTTVTYKIQDACETVQVCSFEVNVQQDDLIYDLLCSTDLNFESTVGSEGIEVSWPEPEAINNCEVGTGELIQTEGPANGSFLPLGVTTISYNYSTGCGNTIECSFDIMVEQDDLTAEIICSEDLVLTIPFGDEGLMVNWPEPETSTNCEVNNSELIQNNGPANGSFLGAGEYLIEYQFNTGCTSSVNCEFIIEILESDSSTSYQNLDLLSDAVNLFPNPAQALINLDISELSVPIVGLNIYNNLGQLTLPKITVNQGEQLIPVELNNYSNGVYFVLLQLENGSLISKSFIVNK